MSQRNVRLIQSLKLANGRAATRIGGAQRRRRGVMMYGTTLMISVLVTGAAMTMVSLQFANRRLQKNLTERRKAQILSRSGTEYALAYTQQSASWRADFTTTPTVTLRPNGLGRIDVTLSDEDGNLLDDDTDPAKITVTSKINDQAQTVSYSAQSNPHVLLGYTIAASGSIFFSNSAVVDGPLYALGNITCGARAAVTLRSRASFDVPTGSVISPVLTPQNMMATAYTMPAPSLSFYASKATLLNAPGDKLEKGVFTAAYSSQGTANGYGIYIVDAGSRNVTIRNIAVTGTLIIVGAAGADIKIDEPILLQPGGNPYPSLIVALGGATSDFDVEIPNTQLNEAADNVDYNQDGDRTDTLPPKITGLAYVISAKTILQGSAWTLSGCLIAEDVTIADGVVVGDGTWLGSQRSPGFTDGLLHPISGSAAEVIP